MSTPNQIAANRENAKLSTGPQSPAGKEASSQNALRHGLTAQGFIVLPGQEEEFDAVRTGLRKNLLPLGELQEAFFTRIVECTWNLHRCRLAEAALYAQSEDQTIDPFLNDDDKRLDRIRKYARQYENSLAKNLRELGRIQTECQYRHEAYPLTPEQKFEDTPHSLSEVCEFQKVMAAVSRQRKTESGTSQNEAKAIEQEALALLERFTTPPSRTPQALIPASPTKSEAA
jgi:hypothetical protein